MRANSGKCHLMTLLLVMCVFICGFVSVFSGPVSLLTMWSNRITVANSRKHQEFVGRVSSVNNKFELYQQLKDENGCVRKTNYLSLHGCDIPSRWMCQNCSLSFNQTWLFRCPRKRQGLSMMFPRIHCFTPAKDRDFEPQCFSRVECDLILPEQGHQIT